MGKFKFLSKIKLREIFDRECLINFLGNEKKSLD